MSASTARATFFDEHNVFAGRGEIDSFGVDEVGGILWVNVIVRFLMGAAPVAKIVITSAPDAAPALLDSGMNSLTFRPDLPLTVRLGDTIHLRSAVSELFS